MKKGPPGYLTMRWLPNCCVSCYSVSRTHEFDNVGSSNEKLDDPEEKEQIELHRTRSDDSLTKNEVLTTMDTSFDITDQLKFGDLRKLKESIFSAIDYDLEAGRSSSKLVLDESVSSEVGRGSNRDWRQASEGNSMSASVEDMFPKCRMKKMKQHSWPSPLTDVFPKRPVRKSRAASLVNNYGNATSWLNTVLIITVPSVTLLYVKYACERSAVNAGPTRHFEMAGYKL